MPSQLGYWAIRGLGQPIRLLLKYVGEDFEDVRYEIGDGPEFNRDAWFSVKYTLGFDFPNLPYYINGDTKLTQSGTILRHLARKYKLYGETEKEQDQIHLLMDQISDLRSVFVRLCYGEFVSVRLAQELRSILKEKHKSTSAQTRTQINKKAYQHLSFLSLVKRCHHHVNHVLSSLKNDKTVAAYIELSKPRLEAFEKYLGDKQFFTGDKVAVCDFPIYEMLDQHRILEPSLLSERPKLTAYLKRFEELPAIKAYMKSETFISRPLNNKTANFL